MISNKFLNHARQATTCSSSTITSTIRGYISRAHPPESVPVYNIGDAITSVLEGVEHRKVKRQERWDRNKEKRVQKGIKDDGPFRNQDETIELALNLNLDPRKPGQALRGSLPLPHGTGKKVSVIVFSPDDDAETIADAKSAGASHVGGASLIESISSGELPANFDRALATPDMMPQLSKIARILGPRGLMPNAKLDTIQKKDKIADAVKAQSAGMVQYRTDKEGIVHAGIGKGSFTEEALADNIREFMNLIQSVKPESYGKGKKGGGGGKKGKKGGAAKKDAKYYLKAALTSSQGKGSVKIDLRSLDPTSSYFMGVPPAN